MQVVDAVRDGRLAAGARLPTVRALAEELGLAVNTVAKAYKELEADGVVEGRGGTARSCRATGDPVAQALQAAASAYADTVARLVGADGCRAWPPSRARSAPATSTRAGASARRVEGAGIGSFGSLRTFWRGGVGDHRAHLLELAEAQQPVLGLEHVPCAGWG